MVKKGKEETFIYVSGGFIEFHGNELVVLADAAERAEEIDLKIAEEAKKRAEEINNHAVLRRYLALDKLLGQVSLGGQTLKNVFVVDRPTLAALFVQCRRKQHAQCVTVAPILP